MVPSQTVIRFFLFFCAGLSSTLALSLAFAQTGPESVEVQKAIILNQLERAQYENPLCRQAKRIAQVRAIKECTMPVNSSKDPKAVEPVMDSHCQETVLDEVMDEMGLEYGEKSHQCTPLIRLYRMP